MQSEHAMFRDRRDAGQVLAREVAALGNLGKAIVLALPRGGVPVAFPIALACHFPLDVLVARKIGAPRQQELALGAIAGHGAPVLNPGIVAQLHLSVREIEPLVAQERAEIARQEALYRAGQPACALSGRTVILVDDGLATGATMRAAVQAVRGQAQRIMIAVPVGPAETCDALAKEADRVVCPLRPRDFEAVGQYYGAFQQVTNDEVCVLLAQAQRTHLRWQNRQGGA